MLRRLKRLLADKSVDEGTKARLVLVINTQIDIIEGLEGESTKHP